MPEVTSAIPQGAWPYYAASIAATRPVLLVVRNETVLTQLAAAAKYFAPDVPVVTLPAWDCSPYDRVSPHPAVTAERLAALTTLAGYRGGGVLILATASALVQKLPPLHTFRQQALVLQKGGKVQIEALKATLIAQGYRMTPTVREPGEAAVRGGIVDFFPGHLAEPVRLDLFGDVLEDIRAFDPVTQKGVYALQSISVPPGREVLLTPSTIQQFRQQYRLLAAGTVDKDPLFNAVSNAEVYSGYEHWLPLFFDALVPLAAYLPPETAVLWMPDAAAAAEERAHTALEAYTTRHAAINPKDPAPYYPVPFSSLYLTGEEAAQQFSSAAIPAAASAFAPVRNFILQKPAPGETLYQALAHEAAAAIAQKRKVVLACGSASASERLLNQLRALPNGRAVLSASSFKEALAQPLSAISVLTAPLHQGFQSERFLLLTDAEMTGERLRRRETRSAAEVFLQEAITLDIGDTVVHIEHGIGRFDGLISLTVGGAAHDCVRVVYAGGDKLFVPVENMDVLSRYQDSDTAAELDKLGAAQWQARKAKAKERIRAIAQHLLKTAALRATQTAPRLLTPESYTAFCDGFPYVETDDQERAIRETLQDLAAGKPMDRLICGDVGFGKTEVALRAAYVAAASGMQVAVLTPTTLLARQHYNSFSKRFDGTGLRLAPLSRLVKAKDAAATRAAVAEGAVDILIATHAVLAKGMTFKNLGLAIIDEEQHFGVKQKERPKELAPQAHILTLSATPIPRTLQLSLAGVREMSLIATPPVDRLAVRTFVLPHDRLVIREALQRELARGGQVFYVVPRVADLEGAARELAILMPQARVQMAHGKLSPAALEEVMTGFVDKQFDVLLSTQIVESGIDIPTANTMIIHRADMFGLAQLYQLRGRIGRGKVRGYAYLTVPANQKLAKPAQKRLEVMQTLDHLGAGFSLASHDMDIRGAGNILGDEQSGHIRDVGIELYQQMLSEAVAAAKGAAPVDDSWTPQIGLNLPVSIPEDYVPALELRMGLYRRAADLRGDEDVAQFRAELLDRFGALPEATENLLQLVLLKRRAFAVGAARLDIAPKGFVVVFRNNSFAKPQRLLDFINQSRSMVQVLPEQKLLFLAAPGERLQRFLGAEKILKTLQGLLA